MGVDIDLLDCGNDGVCGNADDGPTLTATTDADGNVIFPDLPPGNYQLDVDETTLPAGLAEVTTYGANNPNDPISLSEGESYDADFGYKSDAATALLTGTVWTDVNGDGMQNASEIGIEGTTVQVIDPGPDGVLGGGDDIVVATTTTAGDGSWSTSVDPGEYMVVYDAATIPAGLINDDPTNINEDLDGDGNEDAHYVLTGAADVKAGEMVDFLDFGFEPTDPNNPPTGTVDGYVYYEPAPANGDMDGSDSGIESVTVNLVDDNGDVIATATTSDGTQDVDGDGVIDPAGYYSFQGVYPGDYTVVVTDTNNSTIGLNPSGEPRTGTTSTIGCSDGRRGRHVQCRFWLRRRTEAWATSAT